MQKLYLGAEMKKNLRKKMFMLAKRAIIGQKKNWPFLPILAQQN